MERIKNIIPEAMVDLIKRVYEGNETIERKIAVLIVTRRNAHGNFKIQDECNKYLTLLYDEKYKHLEAQSD